MKRFTDTLKWDDPWFRRLSPSLKCLWFYLVDKCDAAGVIEFDPEHASFHIGERVTFADLNEFGDRVAKLTEGKFHIVKFLKFQYSMLSEDSPAHRPVFAALEKHGLEVPAELLKNTPSNRVSNTLSDTPKDKDKDKDKGKEGGVQRGNETPHQLKLRIDECEAMRSRLLGPNKLSSLHADKRTQVMELNGLIAGYKRQLAGLPTGIPAAS